MSIKQAADLRTISVRRSARYGDKVMKWLLLASAIMILALIALFIVFLTKQSYVSIVQFGFRFLTGRQWDPINNQFGALPFIYGTVVTSIIAIVLAGIIGVASAVFLTQFSPQWLAGPILFLIELLAAIPSVVFGIWGIFQFSPILRNNVEPFLQKYLGFLPIFQGTPMGVGMLAAGIVLAIMILPTITSISRDVLMTVPREQKEAALGLGATQWEMIRLAILPYSWPGILGGMMLGLGRALGETMAVTMVIGNRPEIAASLFAPSYSMASVIANEYTEATTPVYLSSLTEIGLLLFIVTILFYMVARLMIRRVNRVQGGRV
jgi:phosphate transport system permease protein